MADAESSVSNLERSAFWIYGVTAMIMREPLGTLLRHAWSVGPGAAWSDPQIRIETLRVLLVLAFLSRLFLAAGLHFETVFMRPGSAARYPRRSYPVDFLAGLIQLLIAVAASTTVSLHTPNHPDLFELLAAAFLLFDVLWLAVTALLRFSAIKEVARRAAMGASILGLGLACAITAQALGASPASAATILLAVLLLLTWLDAALLIRHYGAPAVEAL